MTIKTGQKIVYKDLIDDVYNKILSTCCNIGSFKNGIPSSMKNGSTYIISSNTVGSSTYKVSATVNDDVMVVVQKETVKTQLDQFLADRGIKSKENEVITFKGMMNFYNNIASFFAAKLILVETSFGNDGAFLFYNAKETNYTSVSAIPMTDVDFTPTQIETSMSEMLKAINSTTKTWYPKTNITYTCSSSSSSSSSSSCSSSSSMFIAYMEI